MLCFAVRLGVIVPRAFSSARKFEFSNLFAPEEEGLWYEFIRILLFDLMLLHSSAFFWCSQSNIRTSLDKLFDFPNDSKVFRKLSSTMAGDEDF